MTKRTGRPWLNYLLGLLCVGAIVAAILLVGPASGSTTAVTRTAKAAEGVVQSTVSGSGNLQPASQLNLGFKTSGTVTKIYVTQGEYVTEGKLIAELNPQSAEVTLEQSKATLLSAEAQPRQRGRNRWRRRSAPAAQSGVARARRPRAHDEHRPTWPPPHEHRARPTDDHDTDDRTARSPHDAPSTTQQRTPRKRQRHPKASAPKAGGNREASSKAKLGSSTKPPSAPRLAKRISPPPGPTSGATS